MQWCSRILFMPLPFALVLARTATAFFFLAHAVVRTVNGSISQFGIFMEQQGFPDGVAFVWLITSVEILASMMMILGRAVRYASVALFGIAAGGVMLIHRHFGWFVGEHGTGGSEYSVALMVLLIVVASADAGRRKTADASAKGIES